MTNNDINNLLTTLRYDTRFKNFTDLKHDSCVQLLQEGSKVASYLVYLLRDYRYNLMHGLIANSLPIWHIIALLAEIDNIPFPPDDAKGNLNLIIDHILSFYRLDCPRYLKNAL